MKNNQRFCLRWHNHQSTLVSVFDNLFENGTLVDCTLAAEGKYLNAHKVVLSACSPYFRLLLSQNYDKHPIFILKDVKYQELQAMINYMYKGEVYISQDQLGALLTAAESLQIKGLSDNCHGKTATNKDVAPAPLLAESLSPATSIPRTQGLTLEENRRDIEESRESQSRGEKRCKRVRTRSLDDSVGSRNAAPSLSESYDSSQIPSADISTALPTAIPKMPASVREPTDSRSGIWTRYTSIIESEIPQRPVIKGMTETHSEALLVPKREYIEETQEDCTKNVTTQAISAISSMEEIDDQSARSSHSNIGERSGQDLIYYDDDNVRNTQQMDKQDILSGRGNIDVGSGKDLIKHDDDSKQVVHQGAGDACCNMNKGSRQTIVTRNKSREEVLDLKKPFSDSQTSLPYERRRIHRSWSEDTMLEAVQHVKSQLMTYSSAARHFNVPYSSLHKICRQNNPGKLILPKLGRPFTGERTWSKDVMEKAIQQVKSKSMSYSETARHFNVPYSTLYKHCQKNGPVGRAKKSKVKLKTSVKKECDTSIVKRE